MQTGLRRTWSRLIVAALLGLLTAAALGCQRQESQDRGTPDDFVVMVTSPTAGASTPAPSRTSTPTATPTNTPLQVCSFNPDPVPPNLLQVEEPKPQAKVGVPFHIRGWGSNIGFEDAGVAVAVVNESQQVLQVLNVPPQPRTFRVPPPGLEITQYTRPFAADVVIDGLSEPTAFCLWVYLETAADNTARGVVQVPVLVVP